MKKLQKLSSLRSKFSYLLNIIYSRLISVPQNLYLLIMIPTGVLFALLTPPFQNSDELAHYLRGYQVSEGIVYAEDIGGGLGGQVPAKLIEFHDEIVKKVPIPFRRATDRARFRHDILPFNDVEVDYENRIKIGFASSATYSPVMYAPQAVGLAAARWISASPLLLLTLGKLTNLIFCSLIVYYAIRKTPVQKWTMVLLALMPTTIAQFASLSADAITISTSFLLFALSLNILLRRGYKSKLDLTLYFVTLFLVGLTKQIYIPLAGFALLVPFLEKEARNWRVWVPLFGLTLLALIPSFKWAAYTQEGFSNSDTAIYEAKKALLLHDPIAVLNMAFQTLFSEAGDFYMKSFVGIWAWFNVQTSMLFHILPYYFILFYSAIAEVNKKVKITNTLRLLSGALFFSLCLIIMVALYMTWKFHGTDGILISGVQGRYFIPIAPLVPLAVYNLMNLRESDKKLPIVVALFSLYSAAIATTAILVEYYI